MTKYRYSLFMGVACFFAFFTCGCLQGSSDIFLENGVLPTDQAGPAPTSDEGMVSDTEVPSSEVENLEIQVDLTTTTLVEGANPLEINVSIKDWGILSSATANLKLDGLGLSKYITFEPDVLNLSPSQPDATFQVQLKIGPLPFKAFQKDISIAFEGENLEIEKIIDLNIEPVDAPNIFLLAGQSNMVGSSLTREEASRPEDSKNSEPGALDETHPQIFQLNVTSNSFKASSNIEDFKDLAKIVKQPTLITAEDPLHGSSKTNTKIGPGMTFAKSLLKITEKDIILGL